MKKTASGSTGEPLYRELADRIREDIFLRNLKDSDFYCTMKSLCAKFNTSFITVRNAVALLEAGDVVFCRPAIGMYVKNAARLKMLNSLDSQVLILSYYHLSGGHPFYESRLSAIIQTLAEEGFVSHICHGNNIESEENLEILASRSKGILTSEHYYDLIRNGTRKIGALPRVVFFHSPSPPPPSAKECFVVYDIGSQNRRCCEFLRTRKYGTLAYVSSQAPESDFFATTLAKSFSCRTVEVHFTNERPNIDTGRGLVPELLALPPDTMFWVTDDYVAVGIHENMLKHGIDLIRERRIIVNASPAFEMTEQLGFPVFGFSPRAAGIAAAQALVRMLKQPEAQAVNVKIPVSVNSNVLQSEHCL